MDIKNFFTQAGAVGIMLIGGTLLGHACEVKEPAPRCQEDQACWNPFTMGNFITAEQIVTPSGREITLCYRMVEGVRTQVDCP